MRLEAKNITSAFASYDMVRKARASFQVLAPLGSPRARRPGFAARRLRAVAELRSLCLRTTMTSGLRLPQST